MSKIGEKARHYLAQKPWTPWNVQNQEKLYLAKKEVEEMEQGITGQDLMRRSNEQQLLQQRQRAARGRQPAEIADG